MDTSKIFLNQYVHNNIVSTCNQCDKLLMREKYFYTVFDIYCVLYTYSTPQFRLDAFEVLKCVGQPKVYSIISQDFYGCKGVNTFLSNQKDSFGRCLGLGSPVADPETRI